MRIIVLMLAIVIAFIGVTPAGEAAAVAVQARDNLTTYAIHFGCGNGSGAVTPEVFDGFYEEFIAPRFPAGTVIHTVDGRWHDPKTSSMVKEKSFVIEVEKAGEETVSEVAVDEIAREYVRRYGKANASCFIKKYTDTATKLYYTVE